MRNDDRIPPLRRLLDGIDELLDIVPVVGAVYGTTKKVLTGFGGPQPMAGFRRFVFARLPGRTAPGFLTGSFTLKRADGSLQSLCTVYLPTNHLYVGDVVVVPAQDVIETDLSLEDGVSLILSVGASARWTDLPKTEHASRTDSFPKARTRATWSVSSKEEGRTKGT